MQHKMIKNKHKIKTIHYLYVISLLGGDDPWMMGQVTMGKRERWGKGKGMMGKKERE
jgi:hypothetical protein